MKSTECKVFFATDLHGSDRCFRKFLATVQFYGVSILFLGGDLIGKELFLIRKRAAGRYEAGRQGEIINLATEAELLDFERQCADAGSYTARLDGPWPVTEAECTTLLERAARNRLAWWLELARDRLSNTGAQVVVIPGNDDPLSLDEVLQGDEQVVFNADQRLITLSARIQVAGLGWSTPTPWQTYREYQDNVIAAALTDLLAMADNDLPLVLHVHVPPYGSGLDTCPVLDKQFRPMVGPGGVLTSPVGSRAVYQAILEHHPILGLFGHVHEARGCVRIGDTVCVNPGSEYAHGRLLGFIGVIRRNRLADWLLTEG
jgi:Icc-related predicted phosphoesterase